MIIEKCPLYFKINSERNYIGETPGGGCKSEYRGASRLEVEATLANTPFFTGKGGMTTKVSLLQVQK